MLPSDPAGPAWRTSSYSTDNGDCVEVAWRASELLVRDSKDLGSTGTLDTAQRAWRSLLIAVR